MLGAWGVCAACGRTSEHSGSPAASDAGGIDDASRGGEAEAGTSSGGAAAPGGGGMGGTGASAGAGGKLTTSAGETSGGAADGGSGPFDDCSLGGPGCDGWEMCQIQPSVAAESSAASPPKTSCADDSLVTAESLGPEVLDGLDANFDLVASPPENILLGGRYGSGPGATLAAVTPELAPGGGWSFVANSATQVLPLYLRRGPKGRTFVVGTTDGYLFTPGEIGDQDIFAWSSSSATLEASWTAQLGGDATDSLDGAAATPDGGLAAVGRLGLVDAEEPQPVLWRWDEQGTLATQDLELPDPGAHAASLDVDAAGKLYVLTAAPSSAVLVLSKQGAKLRTTSLDANHDCTDCRALAATASGAVYLWGYAGAVSQRKVRLSRYTPDGTFDFALLLPKTLELTSLLVTGEHVLAVGSATAANAERIGVVLEIDEAGNTKRSLRIGGVESVIAASLADSGRLDLLVKSDAEGTHRPLLVQVAPAAG